MAPSLSGIGMGCMRLSTEADRDEARALQTLEAAARAGVRVFDSARAYGLDQADLGHNERLLSRAGLPQDAVIVTKGGMRRPNGKWKPDGRAKSLREDAEASAEALGRPADLWLMHAPDPRVKLETSVRAMAKILADGTAKAVGLSNVRRRDVTRARPALLVSPASARAGPGMAEGAGRARVRGGRTRRRQRVRADGAIAGRAMGAGR